MIVGQSRQRAIPRKRQREWREFLTPFFHSTSTRVVLFTVAIPFAALSASQKHVAGYVEQVHIHPGQLSMAAKIDTGAENSSLDARNVERFTRGNESWVRFSLRNDAHQSAVVELPVHRIARIRRHGGRVEEREVVMLGICLGSVYRTVEVNIVDRSGLDFPMLIGRSFLDGVFLVDPGERFLLAPDCPVSE